MSFDVDEHDHESKLFWQGIDGSPQPCGTIAFDHGVLLVASCCAKIGLALFADQAPSIIPLPVEREAPGDPNEPRPKAAAIAQTMEVTVGLDEGVLRHIFGILPMAQHGERDAESEPRGLSQLRLELSLEVCIHWDCSL